MANLKAMRVLSPKRVVTPLDSGVLDAVRVDVLHLCRFVVVLDCMQRVAMTPGGSPERSLVELAHLPKAKRY